MRLVFHAEGDDDFTWTWSTSAAYHTAEYKAVFNFVVAVMTMLYPRK